MIKVTVLYPSRAEARFDHDYYRTSHMPLIKARLGEACLDYTVDKGLGGGEPGSPPPFVAMCHIFAETVESFQAAFGPHAAEINADLAHYTDITPVLQISEVIVETSPPA